MLPIIFIISSACLAYLLNKLTALASAGGAFIGVLLWSSFSYTGLLLMTTFFLLGTSSTMLGIKVKYKNGLTDNKTSKRDLQQVIANAGISFLLCLLVSLYPKFYNLMLLMIAGSFSAATADTVSSEIGNVYGKSFYNIINLRKDTKGLNGVVSLEGTLCGIAGSCIIATVYALLNSWNFYFFIIILAGTIGNIVDSILGATLERKNYLNNNQVNFLNTAAGAIVCLLLYVL